LERSSGTFSAYPFFKDKYTQILLPWGLQEPVSLNQQANDLLEVLAN
jgi:hypothetical protein